MRYVFIILVSIVLVSSCKKKNRTCAPEIKSYFFHKSSTICNYNSKDSIQKRFWANRDKYDIENLHPIFLMDGNSIVFEYIYHAEQCGTEPYWEYLYFQIPEYLDKFEVKDKNLKYLNWNLEQTCQLCGCWEWKFDKGFILGNKLNDSVWYINMNIWTKCTSGFAGKGYPWKFNFKFKECFKLHKAKCENYLNMKKPN